MRRAANVSGAANVSEFGLAILEKNIGGREGTHICGCVDGSVKDEINPQLSGGLEF